MAQLIIDLVNLGGGVQTLLSPQNLAASTQGSSFDAQNLDVATNAVLSIGAYGANTTNFAVQIEESSTGTGSWTAIPGMTFTAVTSTAGSNTTQVVRGLRSKQYVRANANSVTGTTASVYASVVLVSQGKIVPQAGGFDNYPST